MKSVFESKEKCTGCGVCKNVCKANAITMKLCDDGFYYPKINKELCTDCGACARVCHYTNKNQTYDFSGNVFAVQSKDKKILEKSQSGGLFAELAKRIISDGGVVYGAAFDEKFEVRHIRINSCHQLYKLQGSKYVQSVTTDIFKAVKTDLESGVTVLFSGTPCQISALYSCVGHGREKLYTADVLCHGVMSPKLWKEYLEYITSKYGEIKQADFRDKSYGWQIQNETFVTEDKKIKKNVFRKIFHKSLLLRPSCYSISEGKYVTVCKYAGLSRGSDITIGDFWGIKNAEEAFADINSGISIAIVNTEKGRELFDGIKQNVIWQKKSIDETIPRQPHLSCKDIGVSVEIIEKARWLYAMKGFLGVASAYGENGIRGIYPKGVRFIKHLTNKILKKFGINNNRGENK